MDRTLVDTDVLIRHMRGDRAAEQLLLRLASEEGLATHAVVVAEILEGAKSKAAMRDYAKYLGQFTTVMPTPEDVAMSLELLRKQRLETGMGWPDSLIAATCVRLGAGIVTANTKHFKAVQGLRVVRAGF